jgi:spermidine synthase
MRFAAVAGAVALGLLALTLVAGLYERLRIARQRSSGDFTSPQDGDVKSPLHRHHPTLGLCVAAMGFTLLGLEVLLLLGFQALYGYVYQQLAVLVALFMVGMAGGAWLALKKTPGQSFREVSEVRDDEESRKSRARFLAPLGMTSREYLKLAFLQLLAAGAPLILYALLVLLASVRSLTALLITSTVVFPVLALIAGLMGGYQFPLASRVYFAGSEELRASEAEVPATRLQRNPGILYGLDLLGACLGAVALSAYLLPLYGFLRTAILMAVVNLGPAALAALAALEVRAHRMQGLSDWPARQTPAP